MDFAVHGKWEGNVPYVADRRKGPTKKLCDKDFAERICSDPVTRSNSGECLTPLVLTPW